MFKFEEIFGVKLFPELQQNLHLVELELSLAAKTVFSTRALDIFEPFPTFFLKEREERQRSIFKEGNIPISEVKKDNKDLPLIKKIFTKLPSPLELLEKATNEVFCSLFL